MAESAINSRTLASVGETAIALFCLSPPRMRGVVRSGLWHACHPHAMHAPHACQCTCTNATHAELHAASSSGDLNGYNLTWTGSIFEGHEADLMLRICRHGL
eukprot:6203299-Pleurochrysis_carterae.AAC.4